LALWPLLLAASAPLPPTGFANGLNGLPRGLTSTLDDAHAAGFDSVRVFLRWDKIETVEGQPDWTCRYLGGVDVGPDSDGDGRPDSWPGIPCDGTPCGCGYSADERVAMAAGAQGWPVMLTIVGTPAWARGAPTPSCQGHALPRALPLRHGKESAFRDFVAAAARRYGDVAYAFALWNEPDLPGCVSWAGTAQQWKQQILSAAQAVKQTGVEPGLVVAPTLEDPSGAAMDTWMDWSQPVDLLSFNLYVSSLSLGLAKIDEMHAWCRGNRRCPGFYITEFGAQRSPKRHCPGPSVADPGAADVALMKRCRARRSCAGFFLYRLTDQSGPTSCGRGLFNARGCRKARLCTIARDFFGLTTLPFACGGCGR
jgi:hypothetical protein